MIIDSHFSIIPDNPEDIERLAISGRYYDRCGISEQLALMNNCIVDRAVVWPAIPNNNRQARVRNEWLAKEVSRNDDKFIGFAVIYPPDIDDSLYELEHAVMHLGLKGVKVHPLAQEFRINDPGFLKVVREIKTMDIPLVIHVDKREPGREKEGWHTEWTKPEYLLDVLEIYNSPKVIAAHMGGICIEDVRKSRISFQTTGVEADTIEYACMNVGSERVMFGSDFPAFEMNTEIKKVIEARISEIERAAIFSGNILKIVNL